MNLKRYYNNARSARTSPLRAQEIYAGFNILALNRIISNNLEEKFIENSEEELLVPCPVISYHKNPHFKIP